MRCSSTKLARLYSPFSVVNKDSRSMVDRLQVGADMCGYFSKIEYPTIGCPATLFDPPQRKNSFFQFSVVGIFFQCSEYRLALSCAGF